MIDEAFASHAPVRAAIDAFRQADEAACVGSLLGGLSLPAEVLERIARLASDLVSAVRAQRLGKGGMDAFLHEYGLATHEGVLLMCVAEALLRTPDDDTQERLIRDKLAAADWQGHLGHSNSLFVNASTWALMLTGRLVGLQDNAGRSPTATVRRLVAQLGEPVVREAVGQAMRILGRQFVMGRSIDEAIRRAQPMERRGYRYSYDMLGESACTAGDAERHFDAYRQAVAAIGSSAPGRNVIVRPGISVKLSALHPRYEPAKADRLRADLIPRLRALAHAAADAGIGLTVDAEEAYRLDLSLDAIDAISSDPKLRGWDGFGVVVQAYQKTAPALISALAEMALGHRRRLMVRLVKGAYWDAEIKRAQERGLPSYPVFTRKASTDVSYLACARQLFAQPEAFFPQFATHNAQTIAAVIEFAGDSRDFELQRLHGMGEALYEQVVERGGREVGCRIYAPVGRHEDLLAYLVRRLLENGANSSFVNRVQDERLPIAEVIADPIAAVRALASLPHPRIALPRQMYLPERLNAPGVDLADRTVLAGLARQMAAADGHDWHAAPIVGGVARQGQARGIVSPADHARLVGHVVEASTQDVSDALAGAAAAARDWAAVPVDERAQCLDRAADLLESNLPALMALAVREAGKTLADALAEVREAADFCRYYAHRARVDLTQPLLLPPSRCGPRWARLAGGGIFACISPWNFPLAIFTGQIAAALAAGNAVIAKPAEQTPLIAAFGVRLLHQAGIPTDVLHLLPGDGARIGSALIADPRLTGAAFTGSIDVAQQINRGLAARSGGRAPLIAETGGQNAMIVDSTALPEQVVRDAIASAFQSAGQRCSALRVLFIQDDVADRIIEMLAGAMDEIAVGDPARLATDVGPVIDEDARAMLEGHIERMGHEARLIRRSPLGPGCERGTFVAPATFEIDRLSLLQREVFGPVLHVLRYPASRLDQVIDAVNETGYGLTLGIQTRIDETWRAISARAHVGNIYVNRNQIGAVVGVQPFGGERLSGTGPKAGGPFYLHRFVAHRRAHSGTHGADVAAAAPAPASSPALVELRIADVGFEQASLAAGLAAAEGAARMWEATSAKARAHVIDRAATGLRTALSVPESEAGIAVEMLRSYAAGTRDAFADARVLPGPTGERNELRYRPRGIVACVSVEASDLSHWTGQVAAALLAGNTVVLAHADTSAALRFTALLLGSGLPDGALSVITGGATAGLAELLADPRLCAVAHVGARGMAAEMARYLAGRDGPLVPLIMTSGEIDEHAGWGGPPDGSPHYLARFVYEWTLSLDTTASGGNASLLSLSADNG
ncbi:MAG: bifunctional proline dehydrogenase/L-glutamate gamma-semialdehyde dehydrogenase PutA [Rhodospirillales bacterium]|nr:bifunctional proline dehydrogenase/L-glutamate gamma-semialdehyde dehydrogenase PutA [Rhodospirillales bacterium]